MEKKLIVSGHQPNYLPWLGFFDKMRQSNVFIIEDNVQFEHAGFTNRTRIKTSQGTKWLTVPIKHMGKPMRINEVLIANDAAPDWAETHWLTLKLNYSKAPYWKKYSDFFEEAYDHNWMKLIDLNMYLLQGLMDFLGIKKSLILASSLNVVGKKSELVLAQCKALEGDVLLAGTGGRNYLQLARFEEEGIKVVFQDFQYPAYPQLHGEFAPNLSVVDYLVHTGGKQWRTEDSSTR